MKQLWFYVSIFTLALGTVVLASGVPLQYGVTYCFCIVSAWWSGWIWGRDYGFTAGARAVSERYLGLDKDAHENIFMSGLRVGAEEALLAVELDIHADASEAAANVRAVVRRDMAAYDSRYEDWERSKEQVGLNGKLAWEKVARTP